MRHILLCLTAILIFSSCTKSDNGVDPNPDNECLKQSLVMELSYIDGSRIFSGTVYEYNSARLLSSYYFYINYTGKKDPEIYYELFYNGSVPAQSKQYENNLLIATHSYEYEGNMLRSISTQYYGNSPSKSLDSETRSFYYDAAKRLLSEVRIMKQGSMIIRDSVVYSNFSGNRPGLVERYGIDKSGNMAVYPEKKYEYSGGNRTAVYTKGIDNTWQLSEKNYFDLSKASVDRFFMPPAPISLPMDLDADKNFKTRSELYALCNSQDRVLSAVTEYNFVFNTKGLPVSGTEIKTAICKNAIATSAKYNFKYLDCD